MTQVSSSATDLARLILGHEAAQAQSGLEVAQIAEQTCRRMRERLAILIGGLGFNSLINRAVNLTRSQMLTLDGVRVDVYGEQCLVGLQEWAETRDRDEVMLTLVAVFANFIALLFNFVGEDLSLRLLRDTWPETLGTRTDAGPERVNG